MNVWKKGEVNISLKRMSVSEVTHIDDEIRKK
jgi:hypothetical protein